MSPRPGTCSDTLGRGGMTSFVMTGGQGSPSTTDGSGLATMMRTAPVRMRPHSLLASRIVRELSPMTMRMNAARTRSRAGSMPR